MDVTSNHLEVVPSDPRGGFGADPMEQPDNGEELTKRSEHFGHPVGKRMQRRALIIRILTNAVDDSSTPPVLICKIRKGQELKVTCIAKKVRIGYPDSGSVLMKYLGHCKRAREVVAVLSCLVRIRSS